MNKESKRKNLSKMLKIGVVAGMAGLNSPAEAQKPPELPIVEGRVKIITPKIEKARLKTTEEIKKQHEQFKKRAIKEQFPFLEYDSVKRGPDEYYNMCLAIKLACEKVDTGQEGKFLDLTPVLYESIMHTNKEVNDFIIPKTDNEMYGRPDYWNPDVIKKWDSRENKKQREGDCEKYMLLKFKMLLGKGISPDMMSLAFVYNKGDINDGHAVLVVHALLNDIPVDLVLDNVEKDVKLLTESPHKFVLATLYGAKKVEWREVKVVQKK